MVGCTLDIKSHDVSEFYENRLLCEIYLCTVVNTIIFDSISRSRLPHNTNTWLYDKRYDFSYDIINFPHIGSNKLTAPTYGVNNS